MDRLTYGSTFSGIGGLDLAVEAVIGATCAWQCELDPFCRSVLAKHWPDVQRYHDVQLLHTSDTGPVFSPDVLCGGFPCQDVSAAGKRVGLEAGARTGLWRELARLAAELRPDVVVLENTPGLLGRGFDRVLRDLAALGFDVEWSTVRASDVGAPHRRERLFALAYTDRGRARLLAERHQQLEAEHWHAKPAHARAQLGHADHARRELGRAGHDHHGGDARRRIADGPDAWPPRPGDHDGWGRWAGPVPGVRRSLDGVTGRVDRRARRAQIARLRALGNAVVPAQAALALRLLIDRLV